MAEGGLLSLQPAADTRATQTVPIGGVNPPLHGDVKSPLQGEAKSPPHRPWTLPPQGLAVFHGDKDTARLSHYFLPRLLLQGKRVLMLDGANCADPRLLERLARQRRVPFEQFSRQIQIARAFTCFQLTELIARVPRLLTDFPAELLIVTAFPELYYDEDVRDWNARVAFEQALANLQRLAGQSLPLTVGLFSSATTFMPSPARRRFFEKACAAGSEVWQFNSSAEGKLRLVCRKQVIYGSDGFNVSRFDRAGTPELGAGVWPGATAGGTGVLRGDVQPRAPLHPGLHLRVSRARHGCDQRGRRA